jgi:hypothetical protein
MYIANIHQKKCVYLSNIRPKKCIQNIDIRPEKCIIKILTAYTNRKGGISNGKNTNGKTHKMER